MTPKIKIESDNKTLIYSGLIKPFKKNSNSFTVSIDNLKYHFVFLEDKEKANHYRKSEQTDKNTLTLYFYNYSDSNAYNIEPFEIGFIDDRNIYINYTINNYGDYKTVQLNIYHDNEKREKSTEGTTHE